MNRCWILVIGAFALVGCVHPSNLPGKYVSKDDFGVFVFRGDDSFGLNVPARAVQLCNIDSVRPADVCKEPATSGTIPPSR